MLSTAWAIFVTALLPLIFVVSACFIALLSGPFVGRFGAGFLLFLSITISALAQTGPVIISQPSPQTINTAQAAYFYLNAKGDPAPTFQWQRSRAGGNAWQSLDDVGTFSGASTNRLNIALVEAARNSDRFRCVVSNVVGSATSASVLLTVNQSVTVPPGSRPAARVDTLIEGCAGAIGKQGVNIQSVMPPSPSMQYRMPTASRLIVKLRDPQAQSLALVMSPTTGSVNLAGVASTDRNLASLLSRHGVRAASPLHAGIVRAKRKQGRSEAQLATAMKRRYPVRSARAPANAKSPDLSSTYIFELGDRPAREVTETIRSLRADADVLSAEEDKLVTVSYIPNDPSYSSSGTWGQSYDDLYGLKKIGTTQAWDVTQGQGVVVAVVDTGIDYNHPDISGNIWINSGEIPGNGIDDDNNGYIDDVRGWDFIGRSIFQPAEDNDPFDGHYHGTHVAGTIAATGDNNKGVVGVAWKAKVMAVKGLDDSGSGYESDLARAIIYAVDNGADVINASWGGAGISQTETDAINYAHANGVVFVAAAGNSSLDANDFTPANVPAAIAVSSLDPFDNLSYFSNFGSKVELAAPGEDILSLEAGTAGYSRLSGTSMAAPHVSGVAALIIAQHPTYSNEQVRQALRVSATDLGIAGKDKSFGYGRVSAAQGVLVNQVLEAKILAPFDGVSIFTATALTGAAKGPGFDHYVVDFGAGATPGSWTVLRNSTTSVASGIIGTFDPSTILDGLYTVRLRAFDTNGNVFSDQIQLYVRYLEIISPLLPPVHSLTKVVKPGVAFPIMGSARGPSFQGYVLEWAPGRAATSGWSTAGFALPGSGLSPVTDGTLGLWTPPDTLAGDYTIRLTVTNTGFSSATTTAIYAEPALLADGWPKFAPNTSYQSSLLPVRQPDGKWRFVLGGTGDGFFSATNATLYSYAPDGSAETTVLDYGCNFQPCVGDLDGEPGDEIVISSGNLIKIFSSNLTSIRTITPDSQWWLSLDQAILADLDNDGVPEIIAPARDRTSPSYTAGVLWIYRVDGSLYPSAAQLTFTTSPDDNIKVLAVDLDGDGRKEIVMAYDNVDRTGYTLAAYYADGTPYVGWASQFFPGIVLMSLAAGDLDGDGTPELIITEHSKIDPVTQPDQVRAVSSSGMTRPGWPIVTGYGYGVTKIAIGDLDGDQRSEIVVIDQSTVSILRDNGSAWAPAWSNGGNPPYNSASVPLIADIDGDGIPEILVAIGTYDYFASPKPQRYGILTSYRLDGSIQRSWPLFGVEGRQPFISTLLVGEFNGDGKTDLVVNVSLIEGGDVGGWLLSSAVTCLTAGTTFKAAASDWTSALRDAKNSQNAISAAPVITIQPTAQTVLAGSTVVLSAAASGDPIPVFQWKKNGTSILGATKAKLILPNVLLSDSGSYAVVVTNAIGSVTSLVATLTVNKGTSVIIWPTPASIPYGTALSSAQLNATAGVPGTFVYSPAGGTVLNAGRHTLNVSFTPADSVNYYGASFQNSLIVNLASGAPLFLVQPVSQSISVGTRVAFTAEASGITAPTYQWRKNGVNINGAIGSSYTITGVVAGDAGSYSVVATNGAGSATSNAAILTTYITPPSNAIITITVE